MIPVLPAAWKGSYIWAFNQWEIAMKAAILKAFGSPLAIGTMPDPVLGTGEVIVDVVAARSCPTRTRCSAARANIR